MKVVLFRDNEQLSDKGSLYHLESKGLVMDNKCHCVNKGQERTYSASENL